MTDQQYQILGNIVWQYCQQIQVRTLTEYEALTYEAACRVLETYHNRMREVYEANPIVPKPNDA